MGQPKAPRSLQRGFSLVIVFLIIIVMTGIASGVMLSTQGDLQVSGHDREAATALYAAEAGVSWAEWWLSRYPVPNTAPFSNGFFPIGAWNSMTQASGAALSSMFCVNPAGGPNSSPPVTLPVAPAVPYVPGSTPPNPGTPITFDGARQAVFQWCVHNNALDPLYRQVTLPAECPSADSCDSDSIVTVESWGYGPNGASTHLSVEVSYFNPVTASHRQNYGQAGSGELKDGKSFSLDPLSGATLGQENL